MYRELKKYVCQIFFQNSVSKEQSSGYPPFLYDKVVLSEYEFLIIANGSNMRSTGFQGTSISYRYNVY
jgi:hypothetical protein